MKISRQEYLRHWWETNKKKYNDKKKNEWVEVRGKSNERRKKWREENPEQTKTNNALFRQLNPNYDREWRKKNPLRVKEYERRRRMKKTRITLSGEFIFRP